MQRHWQLTHPYIAPAATKLSLVQAYVLPLLSIALPVKANSDCGKDNVCCECDVVVPKMPRRKEVNCITAESCDAHDSIFCNESNAC